MIANRRILRYNGSVFKMYLWNWELKISNISRIMNVWVFKHFMINRIHSAKNHLTLHDWCRIGNIFCDWGRHKIAKCYKTFFAISCRYLLKCITFRLSWTNVKTIVNLILMFIRPFVESPSVLVQFIAAYCIAENKPILF